MVDQLFGSQYVGVFSLSDRDSSSLTTLLSAAINFQPIYDLLSLPGIVTGQ